MKLQKSDLKALIRIELLNRLRNSNAFDDSEIVFMQRSSEEARRILERKYSNGFYETHLLEGLSFYCELYGRDEWAKQFHEKGLKKLGK